MGDLLVNKWGSKIVTGDVKADKPGLIAFKNIDVALEILNKHITNNSKIVVHCDVDLDGLGSGYIIKRFLRSMGAINVVYMINKDRIHGIQDKYINYLNNINRCDLLVILDSSTNEVDIIKQINADVMVIDHHEINHNDIYGRNNTGDAEYIIINNMIENSNGDRVREWLRNKNPDTKESIVDYSIDSRMSGAMVLYEMLRVYCEAFNEEGVLENLMLHQWVGITLFSDSILLAPDRNQWYIENTVHSFDVEVGLKIMMANLNKYKSTLDKSFINFTLVPTINRAMRAGQTAKALDIVLNRPGDIGELGEYRSIQDEIMDRHVEGHTKYADGYIMKDMTNEEVSRSYFGVIASRICGDNNRNTVVYQINDNIAEGSFRGRKIGVDYRRYFDDYDEGVFAQGHKAAFGFKVDIELLEGVLEGISRIEPKDDKFYLTAGDMPKELMGKFHIEDMDNFKRLGYFWRLAIANSKLSGLEQLDIITSLRGVKLKEKIGKVYIYEVLGLECKAFEPIKTSLITVYIEYNNEINMYVKNFNY